MKHQKLVILVLCVLAITISNAQSHKDVDFNTYDPWEKHSGNMNHDFGIQKQPFRHGFDKPKDPDFQATIPIDQQSSEQQPNTSPYSKQDLESINKIILYGISIALVCVAISLIKLLCSYNQLRNRRHQIRNLNNYTQQHRYVNFDQRQPNRIQNNLNLDDRIAYHKQQIQKLQQHKKQLQQKRRERAQRQEQIMRENMKRQQMRRQQEARIRQQQLLRRQRDIQMTYPRGIPVNYQQPVYSSPQYASHNSPYQPHPMFANRQPIPAIKDRPLSNQMLKQEQIGRVYYTRKVNPIDQIPSIPLKQDNDSSFASEYPEI